MSQRKFLPPGQHRSLLKNAFQVTPVTNDDGSVTYQASSPDEVAIISHLDSVCGSYSCLP